MENLILKLAIQYFLKMISYMNNIEIKIMQKFNNSQKIICKLTERI